MNKPIVKDHTLLIQLIRDSLEHLADEAQQAHEKQMDLHLALRDVQREFQDFEQSTQAVLEQADQIYSLLDKYTDDQSTQQEVEEIEIREGAMGLRKLKKEILALMAQR